MLLPAEHRTPSAGHRARVWVAGAAGVAWALGASSLAYGVATLPLAAFLVGELIGVSFLGAGLLAWYRLPDNRIGPLMIACGASWYLPSLEASHQQVIYALGYWLYFLPLLLFTHLALAFPHGRLRGRPDRWILGTGYASYLVLQAIRYLREGHAGPIGWEWPLPPADSRIGDALSVIGVTLTLIATARVARRWRAAPRPTRRAYGPVWAGILLTEFIGIAAMVASLAGLEPRVQPALGLAFGFGLVVLPVAFTAGLLSRRLVRLRIAGLVRELAHPVPPARLRDLLATALDDTTLVLGFWSPDSGGYVDAVGRSVLLPAGDPSRTVMRLAGDAGPVAVLVLDAAINHDPTLLSAAAAAAHIALETARLHALERAQMARLVEVAMEERRRIGRDLHDGVQHRLLVLDGLAKQARSIVAGGVPAGADLGTVLDRLTAEAGQAYRELRVTAQGVHPQILTERGLAVAVEERAASAPMPVLVDLPDHRWPPAIEATAYFAISEALTNATKHSGANRVTIAGRLGSGRLVVEIADDGKGGADPRFGSGLVGLRDRIHALGGHLTLDSPLGSGTRLVLELPCG